MVKAMVKHQFPVSAETLWELIGDFGDVCKWSGNVPESCVSEGQGIGALRTLRPREGVEVVDRLIDEGPRHYSYEIVTSPFPVASYQATMRVTAIDDTKSELCWSGEIEPNRVNAEQAKALFESFYDMGIGMMEMTLGEKGTRLSP